MEADIAFIGIVCRVEHGIRAVVSAAVRVFLGDIPVYLAGVVKPAAVYAQVAGWDTNCFCPIRAIEPRADL